MMALNFLSSFALSWALLTLLSKFRVKQEWFLWWSIVVFIIVVLLALTAYIPAIFVNSFDIQWRVMTGLDASLFFYTGLLLWVFLVLPQILIMIQEIRNR